MLDAVPPAGRRRGTALLVPGYTGSKEDFIALLAPLAAAGFRAVAVDQRGQYETGGPPVEAVYAQAELARDITALTRALSAEGGVGARLHPLLDLGVVTYALWQVHADAGSDIPPNLRGLWDQVYGLGPEVGVRIPPLRARLTAHLEWDFAAQSRPEGRLLLVALNFALWRPKGTAPAPPTPADAGPEG